MKPKYTFEGFLRLFKKAIKEQNLKMVVEKSRSETGRSFIRSTTAPKRSHMTSWCPLEIAFSQFGSSWTTAISDGYVSADLKKQIVEAADDVPGHNPEIRQKLLKAAGLQA